MFIILNMTFVHLEWIEHIGVITLNANGHILYFSRVGSLLTRVPHLHVNTLHAQDFAYPGQENRLKHYTKFIYFGFDFRFYSLKHIWMVYFIRLVHIYVLKVLNVLKYNTSIFRKKEVEERS